MRLANVHHTYFHFLNWIPTSVSLLLICCTLLFYMFKFTYKLGMYNYLLFFGPSLYLIQIYFFVDLYLLLNESQNSDKVDFRSLKELPVSTCTMTSSTLYVGILFAFGSYMGFAKLNAFSSLNIFPVLKLVSANGSGCDCSESTYIHN